MLTKPSFALGQLVATPGALTAFERNGQTPLEFLQRHAAGDWGELDVDDKAANDHAISHGERLLAAYRLNDQTKIWIITESDRSVTTVSLPDDY